MNYHFTMGKYFFSICLLWSSIAMASQMAFIRPERAIIYADLSQKAPIGFLRQGKSVKVGALPLFNNTVYPIIVKGKLAYIKVEDVLLVKDYKYQDTRLLQSKGILKEYLYREKFKSKKNIGFTFSSFGTGEDWRALSKVVNGSDQNPYAVAFHVHYEQHPLFIYNLKAQVGFSLFNIDDKQLSLRAKGMHAKLLYTVLAREYMFVDLLAAYYMYPAADFRILNFRRQLDVYGTEFGVQVTRHFDSPFGLRANVSYQTLNIADLDNLDLGLVDGFETLGFQDVSLNGIHVGLSAFFRF
jgi:hypothetical protein